MALRSRIGLNLGWVQKNETISTIKFQGYYDLNSDDKQSTLVHEFVHGMQQSKYGTGGAIVRKKFRGYKPSRVCVRGVNCTAEEIAYLEYNKGKGRDPYFWGEDYLDLMELEAQMEEDVGEDSEYWFDAPEFN